MKLWYYMETVETDDLEACQATSLSCPFFPSFHICDRSTNILIKIIYYYLLTKVPSLAQEQFNTTLAVPDELHGPHATTWECICYQPYYCRGFFFFFSFVGKFKFFWVHTVHILFHSESNVGP